MRFFFFLFPPQRHAMFSYSGSLSFFFPFVKGGRRDTSPEGPYVSACPSHAVRSPARLWRSFLFFFSRGNSNPPNRCPPLSPPMCPQRTPRSRQRNRQLSLPSLPSFRCQQVITEDSGMFTSIFLLPFPPSTPGDEGLSDDLYLLLLLRFFFFFFPFRLPFV